MSGAELALGLGEAVLAEQRGAQVGLGARDQPVPGGEELASLLERRADVPLRLGAFAEVEEHAAQDVLGVGGEVVVVAVCGGGKRLRAARHRQSVRRTLHQPEQIGVRGERAHEVEVALAQELLLQRERLPVDRLRLGELALDVEHSGQVGERFSDARMPFAVGPACDFDRFAVERLRRGELARVAEGDG